MTENVGCQHCFGTKKGHTTVGEATSKTCVSCGGPISCPCRCEVCVKEYVDTVQDALDIVIQTTPALNEGGLKPTPEIVPQEDEEETPSSGPEEDDSDDGDEEEEFVLELTAEDGDDWFIEEMKTENPKKEVDEKGNYLRFRVMHPRAFMKKKFRTKRVLKGKGKKKTWTGISMIYAKRITTKKWQIQSWIFHKKMFTMAKAKAWLKKHKIKTQVAGT